MRWKAAVLPLERDEGGCAYIGQLILQGVPPYTAAVEYRFPLIYYSYAAMLALFGQSAFGIHVGLALLNAVTALLIFLLARELYDDWTGSLAGAIYAAMSAGLSVLGLWAHNEHFVVAPAILGLLFLVKALRNSRNSFFLYSGFFLATALLMKQHGIFFILFALVYLFHERRFQGLKAREHSAFLAGISLPIAIMTIVLLLQHSWAGFWFWTIRYAYAYVREQSFHDGILYFLAQTTPVLRESTILWVLALLGFLTPLWDPRARPNWRFITGLAIFSFFAICPGFYFREHYYILMLPAISIAAGVGIVGLFRLLANTPLQRIAMPVGMLVTFAGLAQPITTLQLLILRYPASVAEGLVFGFNPFSQSETISGFIRRHSDKGERIAVLGSEPEIYFYSKRRSVTKYPWMYPLMERQPYAESMQRDLIREIETGKPKFIVLVNTAKSWLVRPESPKIIFDWADPYLKTHYQVVGIADILSVSSTTYVWDAPAAGYVPVSPHWVALYERKNGTI